MFWFTRFFAQIITNAIGFFLAAKYIPGVILPANFEIETIGILVMLGFLLALLNITVKPFLKAVLSPILVITFGVFIFVINAFLLWILDLIVKPLQFENIVAIFLTTILIFILNLLFVGRRQKIKEKKKEIIKIIERVPAEKKNQE